MSAFTNSLRAVVSIRKKILVFPFDLQSHYLRCISLVSEYFDSEQYEVIFQHSAKYESWLKSHGFESFPCRGFDPEKVMECARRFDFSWLNEADISRVLSAQIEAIELHKPLAVIGDASPTLKMAAEVTSVPFISLLNGYMTRYYAHTRKLSRTHKAYELTNRLPGQWADRITRIAESVAMKKVHGPFWKIRKKMALKRVSSYLEEMEGDLNLVCDWPTLFPLDRQPDKFVFAGPLFYDSQQSDRDWIEGIRGDKPIVLVCMGSTGDFHSLKFLNDSDFTQYTFITAGDGEQILNGQHIIAKQFVNLKQVLEISDAMICHGGNGTIFCGLRAGVPMICLTSHFEQEWNVHALARIGSGSMANGWTREEWLAGLEEAMQRKKDSLFSELEIQRLKRDSGLAIERLLRNKTALKAE